ncbi:hypothetical protein MJL22_29045, partial [Salmonella enterica subsp. enterica serovar Montevideo]|nr:hypothetical protein [Salmonella enterica subsp. enterica serovar Montevideo]
VDYDYVWFVPSGAVKEDLRQATLVSLPVPTQSAGEPIGILTRFHDAWKDKKSFFFCMIAGLLMIVSWSSFIYALTHHLVLDA